MIFIRRNLLWIVVGIAGTLALFGWVFLESHNQTKPKPGIEALDSGRNHVPHGQKLEFKFNPPTGGDHYADWITKGFFDEPREDGSLVHSLEHGYVIINYDCEQRLASKFEFISSAYAHTEVPESTSSASAESEGGVAMQGGSEGVATMKLVNMPEAFRNGSCDNLKNQLKDIYNSNQHKLIVQPRTGMESSIILTAWNRMLKLNNVDKKQIKDFIEAFRDKGPEKTVEP